MSQVKPRVTNHTDFPRRKQTIGFLGKFENRLQFWHEDKDEVLFQPLLKYEDLKNTNFLPLEIMDNYYNLPKFVENKDYI